MSTTLPLLLLGLACAPPDDPDPTSTHLSPVDHLVRASLAMRGVRPSVAELDRIAADPESLQDVVRGWLDDPRTGDTVRDLHAESWLLRTDHLPKPPPVGALAGVDIGAITASLDEAPLKLVEAIVTRGRPYTEVVTTDEAWADVHVADAHGLSWDPAGPVWQASRWTDGRPAAGILSDSSVWQRHMSSDTNHHRARANFVAGGLLCEDYLDRDVAVGVADLDDPYAAESRVRSDPACRSCHDTLDPLASSFFGFRRYLLRTEIFEAEVTGCPEELEHACFPLQMWDPALIDDREAMGMPEPAFYGTPVADLEDLGAQIAADPRFATCTAARFWGWMTQTPVRDVPHELRSALADTLVASGWDAREMMVAVVLHDDFARRDGPVGVQTLRPEHLARSLEDLTGHRLLGDPGIEGCEDSWACYGPVDMLTTDNYGFRALAGGVDGWDVVTPTHTPTATSQLLTAWVAEEAAGVVVDTDLGGDAPLLLTRVGPDTVEPGPVQAQLADLHWRILAERLDPQDARLQATWGLWRDTLERTGEPAHAWKLVIAGLLQDSRMVLY